MPVILDPNSYDLWLEPGMRDVSAASELLRPRDAGLTRCYPISTRINSVANDDEACSAPVAQESKPRELPEVRRPCKDQSRNTRAGSVRVARHAGKRQAATEVIIITRSGPNIWISTRVVVNGLRGMAVRWKRPRRRNLGDVV